MSHKDPLRRVGSLLRNEIRFAMDLVVPQVNYRADLDASVCIITTDAKIDQESENRIKDIVLAWDPLEIHPIMPIKFRLEGSPVALSSAPPPPAAASSSAAALAPAPLETILEEDEDEDDDDDNSNNNNDRVFGCAFCAARFSLWSALKRHHREMHRGKEGPNFCHRCRQAFRHDRSLRSHEKAKHPDQPRRPPTQAGPAVPFVCGVCGKSYATLPSLKCHCTKSHGGAGAPS